MRRPLASVKPKVALPIRARPAALPRINFFDSRRKGSISYALADD
jgi:hypothetical protein